MARHYYLTRSGRLRRKDNTLCFEPVAEEELMERAAAASLEEEARPADRFEPDALSHLFDEALAATDGMGDLALEPVAPPDNETIAAEEGAALAEDQLAAVKVRERRTIPVEDVDALWVFGELELNARVLVFLSQHKVPAHFFNYYGYYAGTFYPREYLQAGYLIVKQVRHYSNRRARLVIAREFIRAGLHNIMRNLRYYATRGADLQTETESVQAEMLRLEEVKDINELMSCEGRARAAYYQAFSRILRNDVEFTKRVRRPPDNIVNALISFTNGLVYSAALTQIYRTQLDPTISFLHEPGARRFSLALDLAEVFKPILADRLIFKLLNQRQLNERDFAQDLNCCYLKEQGRKTVLKEWDARLQKTIEHRRLRRKVSYEGLIRLECYKLIKHLTGVEPYVGFRAWW
jgi:CRISPR-associated protein Cas1